MRLITHVTELQTGVPRSAGPIQFLFRQGDSSFDHSQAAPENPGLYLPVIKFPKEGEWQASEKYLRRQLGQQLTHARVFAGQFEALEVLKLKGVTDALEASIDAFEKVANTIEQIVVKES